MQDGRLGIAGAFALVAAVTALLLVLWQSQLVAPSGPGATAFSAEHAFATLSGLLKEQRPHTAGSPENAVVRDRIVAELRAAGYAPTGINPARRLRLSEMSATAIAFTLEQATNSRV